MDEQPILTSEESQPILYELFECNIQENGKLNNNDDENFKPPLGFFFFPFYIYITYNLYKSKFSL